MVIYQNFTLFNLFIILATYFIIWPLLKEIFGHSAFLFLATLTHKGILFTVIYIHAVIFINAYITD